MKWFFKNAKYVQRVCGVFVDWDEEFYICPECDEPVLAEDWSDEELKAEICPICGLTREDLE